MTTQLATQAPGQPVGHTSYVPGDAYVYDIEHRSGLAMPKIALMDLEALTMPVTDMGSGIACPVATGACVTSTAGGDVVGYDMYGQHIMETVAAAGTSTIAFASIVSAPDDAAWVNQFGLPYKYLDDAAVPNADVTITASAEDEDARGTFAYAGDLTDPVEVEVPYMVDRDETFGAPYAERFASAEFDTSTLTITGTITEGGLATVTIPSTGGTEVPCQIKWGDGSSEYAASGTAPTHQYSGVWLSQYGRNIHTAEQMSQFVTVDPVGNEYAPVYVTFDTAPSAPMIEEPSGEEPPSAEPEAPPAAPWASHALAETWLDQFTTATGGTAPLDWSAGATLTEKHAMAQQLYNDYVN